MTIKLRILAALASTSCLATVPAFAQSDADAPVQSEADNQEIIVRALRRDEALQDVAMSVDVVNGDQLQKLNIFDTKDIQQLSPGLELTNNNGRSNTTTLRGINFDPDQGTSPAVQIYLNEIPADAQTVFTALYDIDQIEVLRGPQGLLRGTSAPAGAITISTRRPDFDSISGYAQITGTNRHAYNVQGGVTLPFSEKFAMRAAVLVDGNRLNQVNNVTRNDRSRSTTQSARLTLGWRPSDRFTAYLTYQYLEADNTQYLQVVGPGNAPSLAYGDPRRSGPAAGPDDYIAVGEGPSRFQNRSSIVNLNMDWDLGPVTLSFVGAHQDTTLRQSRDTDYGNAILDYQALQTSTIPFNVNTAELRLASNGEGVFSWGIGAFYSKQTGTTLVSQRADNFPAAVGPAPIAFGLYIPITTDVRVPVLAETLSFNANGRVKIGKLSVEGGVRYSILSGVQTADIHVSSPGNPAFFTPPFELDQVGIPPELQRRKEKPLTGGITISYEPSDALTLYAAYGHSFRAGTSGVAVPVAISADLIRTGPEKTDSWEVGAKASLFDHRLNFNVAAYYQKIDGFLSRFTGISYNCPDFFGACNAFAPPINNAVEAPDGAFDFNYNADATVKGIEGSIEGRVLDNWDVSLNMAYSKARFENARVPCNDYNGDGRPDGTGAARITGTGNVSYCIMNGRLSDMPDFSLSANSEIRFPVGNVTPFIRGLVSYRPEVFSERSNYTFDERTLVNLYVGLRSATGRWEINAFAKNLLDERKITTISGDANGGGGGTYVSGYRIVNVTLPREFGVTTTFKF